MNKYIRENGQSLAIQLLYKYCFPSLNLTQLLMNSYQNFQSFFYLYFLQLDTVALLLADPAPVNFITDTDTRSVLWHMWHLIVDCLIV